MSETTSNVAAKPGDQDQIEDYGRRQAEAIEKYDKDLAEAIDDYGKYQVRRIEEKSKSQAQDIERFKDTFCAELATSRLRSIDRGLEYRKFSYMDQSSIRSLYEDVSAQLKKITDDLQAQIKPKPSGVGSKSTVDGQSDLRARLVETKQYQKAIDEVFLTAGNPRDPDDIQQAFELKRRGIRTADLRLADYNDETLDRTRSKEDFAGGQVNNVAKLAYKDKVGIFKPEGVTTTSSAWLIDFCGIDKSAPRFGNRNIASRAISDVLGTDVIPEACYTIHDVKIGLLMDMAPGAEVSRFNGFDPDPPSEDMLASLQKQLNGLEWTDMLTGQGDRHSRNYMIDCTSDSVKITGIDNDFCFGRNQGAFNNYSGIKMAYKSAGKPLLIEKATYTKIMDLDFAKDIQTRLNGLLSDEEITATASRVAEMKEHARSLYPHYIVEDWKKWRSPKTMATPDGLSATEFLKGEKDTLFGRDFAKKIGSSI